MAKQLAVFFVALGVFFSLYAPASAALFSANNKVGIHVSSPTDGDIDQACALVNGSGGKWGYVTLVIQENDRNHDKWQNIFDKLRDCQVIPIIRLATRAEGSSWRKPDVRDAILWANFLDSLNWPIAERYVVLFNEPNHGTEWGGGCDGGEYADRASFFTERLKAKSDNFFVMLAGLDQSAPQRSPDFCDEAGFLSEALNRQLNLFDNIDGLASHSYPNPGFVGSPHSSGRGTIRGYEWELSLLKRLGVEKTLPVFITETGWDGEALGQEKVASFYQRAFETVWLVDDRVRAITPFDLHIGPPFTRFSWRVGEDDQGFFNPQYEVVLSIPKLIGDPPQQHKAEVVATLPNRLVEGSTYTFQLWLKNIGQAIWGKESGYDLELIDSPFEAQFSDFYKVRPQAAMISNFTFKPGSLLGNHNVHVGLFRNGVQIMEVVSWNIEVVAKPDLTISTTTFPGFAAEGENFELQIYDPTQKMVFDRKNVRVSQGKGTIEGIDSVALDQCYRVVLLRPSYLPVQRECVMFHPTDTVAIFPQMLAVDRNGDGKLSFADLF